MFAFSARQNPLTHLVLIATAALIGSNVAVAHEGPPFPILMDKPLAGYTVSVWADPDIGEAAFFIIIESPDGGVPDEIPQVSIWTEPKSGRLERATYQAERQELKNQTQFKADPYFDQRDQWTVGFRVTPPGGETRELTTEVESTPPGYGAWDFVIYLFPFVFLGGFWAFALVRRRRLQTADQREAPAEAPQAGTRNNHQAAHGRLEQNP